MTGMFEIVTEAGPKGAAEAGAARAVRLTALIAKATTTATHLGITVANPAGR